MFVGKQSELDLTLPTTENKYMGPQIILSVGTQTAAVKSYDTSHSLIQMREFEKPAVMIILNLKLNFSIYRIF